MIVMHAHTICRTSPWSTTLACSSVHISAGMGQGWAVGGRVMDILHCVCKVTALSFPLPFIYTSIRSTWRFRSFSLFFMHPIHTQAAAASRITICCCTTSQFVIVLVLHVCWYTYLQFGTATSKCMRPCGYTCSLYLCADGDKRQAPGWDGPACPQRRGCPAGVQTARASNAAACSHLSPAAAQLCPVLETPCVLMLICVLRHYRKKDKHIT